MFDEVMWALVTMAVSLGCVITSVEPTTTPCEDAKIRCAFRTGCGQALHNFFTGCSAVNIGATGECPEQCQHALIALTSTEEGKTLMTCACSDDFCRDTKRRIEVCRTHVERATRNESVVSCRVAQAICAADALCSTALSYYHRFCRAMFHGNKCTHRCNNSISILQRQEKAAKLDTCKCDGREDYNCEAIKANMAMLCFHNYPEENNSVEGRGEEEKKPATGSGSLSNPFFLLTLVSSSLLMPIVW